jgi:hypothetical protein
MKKKNNNFLVFCVKKKQHVGGGFSFSEIDWNKKKRKTNIFHGYKRSTRTGFLLLLKNQDSIFVVVETWPINQWEGDSHP